MGIAPFPDPQIIKKLFLTEFFKLVAAELFSLGLEIAPGIDPRQKVRAIVFKSPVSRIGLLALVTWALSRILHGQSTDNEQNFGKHASVRGRHEHTSKPRIQWQTRKLIAQRGEILFFINRTQFFQQTKAIAN